MIQKQESFPTRNRLNGFPSGKLPTDINKHKQVHRYIASAKTVDLPKYFFQNIFSNNNTHQPALTVIDNLLHGVLKLHLALGTDSGKFALYAILDQLFN